MHALFKLLAAVSERKYALVYPRAEELHQLVQPPSFPSELLGQILAGMTTTFLGKYIPSNLYLNPILTSAQ